MEDMEVIGTDVLASVLDALPGKTVDVHTDLRRVWGRKIDIQEIDKDTLRLTLLEKDAE